MPPPLRCTYAQLLKVSKGQRSAQLLRPKLHRNASSYCFRRSNSNQTQLQKKSCSRIQSVATYSSSFCQPFQSRYLTSPPAVTPAHAEISLEERLKLFKEDQDTFDNAIHGKEVPLELGSPKIRACIIRGIRHHDNFGTELRGHHEFDRALNARSIMSNRVPEMKEPGEFPYCIWHPDVATEDTYRQVARRYPQMRYQVGRACAVAGYVDLYRELELLPDVAIAEEARDNEKNGSSIAIFDDIMAAPVRYAVMNDYTRSVDAESPQSGVGLNADTAVRSSLEWKRKHSYLGADDEDPHPVQAWTIPDYSNRPYVPYAETETYWNITEDWSFNDNDSGETPWARGTSRAPVPDLRVPLLYSPLPRDLPNINKDLLIFEAAYSGNVDRYARLRRPKEMWPYEERCIIRGIHHSTMFAKWWSLQPDIVDQSSANHRLHDAKIRAINARFIMNNNLSRITDETPEYHLPYLIYWPTVADEEVYAALFLRKPSMKLQIARACIVGNYERLYKAMDVEPDQWLLIEARESPNPFFLKDLLEKGAEDVKDQSKWADWKEHHVAKLMKSDLGYILEQGEPYSLRRTPMDFGQDGIWDGGQADMSSVETCAGNTTQKLYGE